MIKKFILLIVLISLVGGGFLVYRELTQKAVIKEGLSSESKAFIKEQQKANDSDWKYTDLEGQDTAGDFVGKRVEVGNCLSFVMVFRVTNPRQDGDCQWYFGIDKPKGMVVVYMNEVTNIGSTDQIDGVSMRQMFKEKYKESKMTVNGNEYLIFHGLESGMYEANVFLYKDGKAFVFNLITQSPDNFDKELKAMLQSIEFKK